MSVSKLVYNLNHLWAVEIVVFFLDYYGGIFLLFSYIHLDIYLTTIHTDVFYPPPRNKVLALSVR